MRYTLCLLCALSMSAYGESPLEAQPQSGEQVAPQTPPLDNQGSRLGKPETLREPQKSDPFSQRQQSNRQEQSQRALDEANRNAEHSKDALDRARIERNTPRERNSSGFADQKRADTDALNAQRDYRDAKTERYWQGVRDRHNNRSLSAPHGRHRR